MLHTLFLLFWGYFDHFRQMENSSGQCYPVLSFFNFFHFNDCNIVTEPYPSGNAGDDPEVISVAIQSSLNTDARSGSLSYLGPSLTSIPNTV